ncbi:hypothetical protein A1O7_06671 [Cladophialophora yegresii CBS 114405]|uniref:Heterokaryon incompatibility domain-containing protein n=1 Tax=Cladophialophora yegresii CBS 114405 TaxID=1182544 RepID=W9WL85_9EURO|nr:uncharacterized protein A1O7_06671 [Cladophialophora yegresii CBS 114405]EXJ59239.1 hypothetical protein A1O7_06671 [Cladophialophora yegresii CBS 114405]
MLCHDCQCLVQEADRAFHGDPAPTSPREVCTQAFQKSVYEKCYLCTRLLSQLGDEKWQRILQELPKTNVVVFDKTFIFERDVYLLIRLGCKLTPILDPSHNDSKPALLGKSYSYGYLQAALLPQDAQSPSSCYPSVVQYAKSATTTSDLEVLDLAGHWLEICTSNHSRCRELTSQSSTYPSRLIDVSPSTEAGDVWKLVDVDTEAVTGPYITLSHRWGSGTVKLQRDTHKQMLRGMPVSTLPRTYQEAITVTRHLEVRYLWVDSICIFQDERLDIQKEAVRMAEVSNALCNISALSGRDDGLFCHRDPETISSSSVFLHHNDYHLSHSYLINDLDLWRGELVHMPLTTRGWVLQEEVLANRTLYFGARQVLWACRTSRACETYPSIGSDTRRSMEHQGSAMSSALDEKRQILRDSELESITSLVSFVKGRTDTFAPPPPIQNEFLTVWARFVSHYSTRALTFPTDKLLAIAGVARVLSRAICDRFVAGLWESHLMEGLLWYIRTSTITERPTKYRAPTWSWASCQGYVIHAEPFQDSRTVARALNVVCETASGDECGVVDFALLTLQACCLCLRLDEHGIWTAFYGRHKVPRLLVRLDTSEDITKLGRVRGAVIRTTAYRLTRSDVQPEEKGKILLAAQGIILAATSTKSPLQPLHAAPLDKSNTPTIRGDVQYRRIGYFALEDRKGGTLTPKWLAPGCRIFRAPSQLASDQSSGQMKNFDFLGQQELMSTFDIV